MNVCKRIFFCVAGSLWSLGALAASDPVSWSLSPVTGFPSTAVGQQSAVEYTLTNQLPLPTQMVTQTVIKGGNFSVTDKCNKVTLAPKASCNIGVSFTPASAQKSTFQLIYGYDNNRIKLPILTAMGTGQSSTLSGVIQGLPATLAKGVDGKFTAIYTNNGITTLTGCTIEPNFTTSGVPATLQSSQGVPPCTGSLLAKHSCHLNGSI
ncbi:MAG: hypothetical protein PSV35_07705, partial [bacterium]|nr:hypothetical protein [bacterium]